MPQQKGPMPTVEFKGEVYSLTSRKTVVPELATMETLAAFVWIARNTRPRGRRRDDATRLPTIRVN